MVNLFFLDAFNKTNKKKRILCFKMKQTMRKCDLADLHMISSAVSIPASVWHLLSSAAHNFILLYGNYPSHAGLYSQTRQSTPLSTEV